jgi:hypothetical protein
VATIDPGRLKHLEMLQQVITRMAGNSFLVKGWSITLISALLAFAAKDKISIMAWVAILPWLAFWMLDGFFLHQERLFRRLFDHYRAQPQDTATDFSMDTRLEDVQDKPEVKPWFAVMFSRTLLIFHGLLVCLIVAVILAAYCGLIPAST